MNGLPTALPQPRIGGRIEETGPVHGVPKTDRLAMGILLVLATAVHGWLFSKTVIPARDGLSFSRLALQLESPSRIASTELPNPTVVDVLRKAEQPPGFPMALLAVSKGLRAAMPITGETDRQRTAMLGECMLMAGQIACCLGGILCTVPMFLIGRMLAGRFIGFAAATLFQVLPVAAQVTSDCLSEGCYLLALLSALWLGARGLRRTGLGNFLAAGLLTGAAYLVRPEGGLVAVAIGLTLLLLVVLRQWSTGMVVSRGMALIVGMAIVAGPYMLMIGGISNKPSEREFWQRLIFTNPREKLGAWEKTQAPIAAPAMLFADWASDQPGSSRARFAVAAVANETFKSGHYLVIPLAMIGLFSVRRQFPHDGAMMLFAVFTICSLTLLIAFAAKIGYISERHTLPAIAVLGVFAAIGMQSLIAFVANHWPSVTLRRDRWLLLVMVVLGGLPSALRTPHANRIGLKKVGEYLRDHATDNDIIVDPFSWSQFYAGASVISLPDEPDTAKTLYTVLPGPADPSQHDRLPKMQQARGIAASGTAVYSWPEHVSPEQARVVVYKTTR